MLKEKSLVDVTMLVYNHEKYLVQAIEGVVNQQTNFPFRLIIGEDCSKDGSREIIKRYAEKYPEIILPVFHDKNLGANANGRHNLSLATAKYVAACEGDDYWIDNTKLQRQVDFMEAHPDFSMCFTDAKVVNETGVEQDHPYEPLTKEVYTIEDFIMTEKVFVPTVTMLFKNILPKVYPSFYVNAVSGDIASHLLLVDNGPAGYLKGETAVYRQNMGGVTKTAEHMKIASKRLFAMYVEANSHFNYKYDSIFRRKLFKMSQQNLLYGSSIVSGEERSKHIREGFAQYFKYAEKVNVREVFYYVLVLYFPWLLRLKKKK